MEKIGIKIFNKIISVLLIIFMCLASVPNFSLATGTSVTFDGVTAALTDDGTLIFSGEGEIPNNWAKDSEIFSWNVENVIINTGITKIGDYAFSYYKDIKSVNIQDGLKQIGKYAFQKCEKLSNIIIPNSVEKIGDRAFENCESLQNLDLPSGITELEEETFYGCSSLKSINISKNLNNVDGAVFSKCENLQTLEVDKENPYLTCEDGILFSKDLKEIISFPRKKETEHYQIPNEITKIGNSAFWGTHLKSIEIPNSVLEIGDSAFTSCNQIKNIDIPYGVVKIGTNAFAGCEELETLSISNSVKEMGFEFTKCRKLEHIVIPNSVEGDMLMYLFDCDSLKTIKVSKNVRVIGFYTNNSEPLTLYGYKDSNMEKYYNNHKDELENKKIYFEIIEEPYSFEINENGELTVTINGDVDYLDIPEKVDGIKVKSIYCVNIKNVTQKYKVEYISLPNTLETIADYAFVGCGIEEIRFSNSLKTIGKEAFNNNNLTEVEIPESVQTIGDGAFKNCQDLEKITIPHDVQITSNPFGGCSKLTIYCYDGSDAQECAENNHIPYVLIDENIIDGIKYVLNKTEKTATVSEVTEEAVNNGKLTIPSEITTPNNEKYTVTVINANAVNIDGITSLELPETLLKIKNNAFTKYTGDVEIPKNVEELDINAFATHQVNITINEENENYYLGKLLYDNGKSPKIIYGLVKDFQEDLKLYSVPECVTEIGDRAFKYCHNFEKIKIGAQVNKIGYYAFDGIENQVTIQGYNDSYAQRYATQHNISFESLGDMPYFRWTKDNYSFINSSEYFSAYDIGEFENYMSNSLLESYKDEKQKEKWGGSCFGMAATALLFRNGHLNQEYWQYNNEENDDTYDLTSPITNDRLRYLINLYQVLQSELKLGCFEKIDTSCFQELILEFGYNFTYLQKDNCQKEELSDFYNKVKEYYTEKEEGLLLCGYNWSKGGHAVLITEAPQELDYNFYNERKWEFNENDYYGYRIPIYNVNDSGRQQYIYIKNDFSSFAVGNNDSISKTFSTTSDGNSNSSNDGFLSIDAYKLNLSELFSVENIIKNGEKFEFDSLGFDYIEYKNGTQIKVTDKNNKYADINGLYKVDGDLDCEIDPIYNATADEEEQAIKKANVVLDSADSYSVETVNNTDALDISILTGDSYMSVKTTAGGKATFENKKSVTLENPTGGEYETKLTLNEEFVTLPYYTITAIGTGATQVKTEMTEDGALITGDNLENIKVIGNNTNRETELDLSTDKTKVLVKANTTQTNLEAYVDNDNNGTYETKIGEGEQDTISGDVSGNGEIDPNDYIAILRHIAAQTDPTKQKWILSEEKQAIADVTKDGKIDLNDVIKIKRYIAAKNDPNVANAHPNWLKI